VLLNFFFTVWVPCRLYARVHLLIKRKENVFSWCCCLCCACMQGRAVSLLAAGALGSLNRSLLPPACKPVVGPVHACKRFDLCAGACLCPAARVKRVWIVCLLAAVMLPRVGPTHKGFCSLLWIRWSVLEWPAGWEDKVSTFPSACSHSRTRSQSLLSVFSSSQD